MPIYKRCSRCGKRMEAGTVCSCQKERHRDYDRHGRDQKSRHYYNSNEWLSARSAALEADDGIDVYIYMTRGEVVAADTVHHIIPLKDDWSRRNDIDNLMSLNHDTHSTIERMYRDNKHKMEQDLMDMLRVYRNTMED